MKHSKKINLSPADDGAYIDWTGIMVVLQKR